MARVQPDRGRCRIDACPKGARARGMCTTHLERERKWGDPLCVKRFVAHRGPLIDQLFEKVRPEGDCWMFIGPPNKEGYGEMGKPGWMVHRLAYTYMVADIPEGLDLDHLCHNADPTCRAGKRCPHRRCVNPYHLEPVSKVVNAARRWDHTRTATR